jgi:hypothetical protein
LDVIFLSNFYRIRLIFLHMCDILVHDRNDDSGGIFLIHTKPFNAQMRFKTFLAHLHHVFCGKNTHVPSFYYRAEGHAEHIVVSSEADFVIFKQLTTGKFSKGIDQKVWLEYAPDEVMPIVSTPLLEQNKDAISGFTLTLRDSDGYKQALYGSTTETVVELLDKIYRDEIAFRNSKSVVTPISTPKSTSKSVMLVLDTNVFAFYAIELIEKFVNDPRIRVQLPYIIFRELDDFKGNRKSTQEGDMMRYVGRKSLQLINNHINKKIFISPPEDSVVTVELGTQVKKDDIIMWTIRSYEKKFVDYNIIIVTRDEGVEIRLKIYPDTAIKVYSTFDQLSEYLATLQ